MSGKTKNNDIDIQSIINNLSHGDSSTGENIETIISDSIAEEPKVESKPVDEEPKVETPLNADEINKEEIPENAPLGFQGRLWMEFMKCLEEPADPREEDIANTRRYTIDDDIVETLHQCDFKKSNTEVINSILRVFLTDNLINLKNVYRPKRKTLFEQYTMKL